VSDYAPQRWRHSSDGPWEDTFGYSRAIRTGDHIIVSGCTAVVNGTVRHAGDAGAQMGVALDTVQDAITALGGALGDVTRTRIYVVNRADYDGVGRVHGERFADIRPAATMVLVAGLLDEEMLVEVEAEARVGSGKPFDRAGRRT